MSGLNKEEEDRERPIAQFTAFVSDLSAHRARCRGFRPGRTIAESITLDDSSDEEIHPPQRPSELFARPAGRTAESGLTVKELQQRELTIGSDTRH